MRIKEEFKKFGYFYLPSSPEKQIPGILSISDGGMIELEIFGHLDKNTDSLNNNYDWKRIVGVIEYYGFVTLENCFYKQKQFSNLGISRSQIHVDMALCGIAYKEDENILFDDFQFCVEGTYEWVGKNGVKIDNNDDSDSFKIIYHQPEEISLKLKNDMRLFIVFDAALPYREHMAETVITQETSFRLVSSEPRELNSFISIANKLTTFLCFANNAVVCTEPITATSRQFCQRFSNGSSRLAPIKIYYPTPTYLKNDSKISQNNMLFGYEQIKNDAETKINNWISAYDTIEASLDLYFSTKIQPNQYRENKFLALAQCLESFHDRTSDKKKLEIDDKEYEQLKQKLLSECPQEYQEWLKETLNHANKITLRKRLKYLINPLIKKNQRFIGRKKIDRITDKITDKIHVTRNYLTHYGEDLKLNAAKGQELWDLILVMGAIFQYHILEELGFSQEEIDAIVNRSQFNSDFMRAIFRPHLLIELDFSQEEIAAIVDPNFSNIPPYFCSIPSRSPEKRSTSKIRKLIARRSKFRRRTRNSRLLAKLANLSVG